MAKLKMAERFLWFLAILITTFFACVGFSSVYGVGVGLFFSLILLILMIGRSNIMDDLGPIRVFTNSSEGKPLGNLAINICRYFLDVFMILIVSYFAHKGFAFIFGIWSALGFSSGVVIMLFINSSIFTDLLKLAKTNKWQFSKNI